jgi:hypothetical protein
MPIISHLREAVNDTSFRKQMLSLVFPAQFTKTHCCPGRKPSGLNERYS